MSDHRLFQAVLRTDFNAFVEMAARTINSGAPYLPNWHIEAITYQLLRCRDGEVSRLLITQPPRSLKSICTSVAYVAWMLGHDPTLRFICVSYSNELAAELARQFRLVIDSNWYRELFPGMRPAKDTGLELVTTRGGGRLGTSIGGTLTGRGADVIVIDDPLKAEDAQSKVARDRVNSWFAETLLSRLNDKSQGVIVAVMQRLHEEDLAGHLLEQGGWQHLDLLAIAIDDEEIALSADEVHCRKTGEALHPERESLDTLAGIKATIGSLTFSAQYQQRPVPLEGNLIKRPWFRTYDLLPLVGPGIQVIQSWDPATTVNKHSDYSSCTTWLNVKQDYYLKHVLRERLEYPDLKRRIISMARQHGAQVLLIEDAGAGKHLIQDLRDESNPGVPRPIGPKPEVDKVTRMAAQAAKIEAGQVYLPKEAPWLDIFLSELLGFPNTKHDDQVDSVSQFLTWASRSAGSRSYAVAPGELFKHE